MIALSPRCSWPSRRRCLPIRSPEDSETSWEGRSALLLHADLKTPSNENELVPVVPLGDETFEEFRRRTIGNTFREIIGDEATREIWKASEEFQARAELMKDAKRYNELVWQEGSKELWRLNKYRGHK